jgi:hypothetical protein
MQTLYIDTMNRINSVGMGSNWTPPLGVPSGDYFNIAGGNAVSNVYADDTYAIFIGNTAPFSSAQFSQITVGQITTAGANDAGIGCIVRANVNNTWVRCFATHGVNTISVMDIQVNGAYREMAQAVYSVNTGDKILLTSNVSANPAVYTMYVNGVQVLQANDANISGCTGAPGIAYSSEDSGSPLDGVNNWTGGIMATRNYGLISFIE